MNDIRKRGHHRHSHTRLDLSAYPLCKHGTHKCGQGRHSHTGLKMFLCEPCMIHTSINHRHSLLYAQHRQHSHIHCTRLKSLVYRNCKIHSCMHRQRSHSHSCKCTLRFPHGVKVLGTCLLSCLQELYHHLFTPLVSHSSGAFLRPVDQLPSWQGSYRYSCLSSPSFLLLIFF